MKDFVYIILHYKNRKDTLECIESIRKNSQAPIVIVDNDTLTEEEAHNIINDFILFYQPHGIQQFCCQIGNGGFPGSGISHESKMQAHPVLRLSILAQRM